MEQLVILGAGYDTRCYRFSHLPGLRGRFEVDRPKVQRAKRRALERAGVPCQAVTFVPCDLAERGALARALTASPGYDPARRTLFIWEGVSYYLTEEAVRDTLKTARGLGSAERGGMQLAMDYAAQAAITGERSRTEPCCRRILDSAAATGEPLVWGLEMGGDATVGGVSMGSLAALLASANLAGLEHSKPGFSDLLPAGMSVESTAYKYFHLVLASGGRQTQR